VTGCSMLICRGKYIYVSLGAKRGASIASWLRATPDSSRYQVHAQHMRNIVEVCTEQAATNVLFQYK
jgi:hypothetical protein